MALPSEIQLVAIDDDPLVLNFIEKVLAQPGLQIYRFTAPGEGWAAIQRLRPEIVVLDRFLPDTDGMQLLKNIVDCDPTIQVVMLTGELSTESAVASIHGGACDYLTKPIKPAVFRERIEQLIVSARQRRQAPQPEYPDVEAMAGMIGYSSAMLDVRARLRRVAPHFQSVLITGATGTGKELAARALHQMSPLSRKPFVVCNCAAITDTLVESELFGHVRGAFTGATQDRAGFFESADGGVLFLDEIGEIPLRIQAKFLRALQNGEVQRVGSSTIRRVSLRVVAASNRDLRDMVRQGAFREDLFFRLAMLEVKLPPLTDRKEDLFVLCRHFIDQFVKRTGKEIRGITRRAQIALARYAWPGNIRELANVIGHGCMMTENDLVDIGDLPENILSRNLTVERQERLTLEEVEARHVRYILEETGGNKQMAAEILGISRATLYRFLSAKDGETPVSEIA
jgi:DNA-binding NtrC family response regulator